MRPFRGSFFHVPLPVFRSRNFTGVLITCFGDSGGPNYLGTSNVIAAVTSFGRNGNCVGTGGVFRLDRKNVLDFVGQYLK